MSLARVEAINQTHNDVERLIGKIVAEFHATYGGDWLELRQDAVLFFMGAFNTYRPSKGEFTTWVGYCVTKGLMEIMRTKARRNGKLRQHTATLEDVENRRFFDLQQFISDLSEDAQEVVKMAVFPPKRIERNVAGHRGPQNYRKAIRVALSDIGWTAARIAESFTEIREALQ